MKIKKDFSKILGLCITILVPLITIMISIRLLITPLFTQVEYRMPGFPEDPFGFTFEDRLIWSEPSIRYLVNKKDILYLESLQFETGEQIFNEQELDHMEDVKRVVSGMRIGLASALVILGVIHFIVVNSKQEKSIFVAYKRGGWGVIGIILSILIFVTLNFNKLFTWFHMLFFEGGTWQFYTSDTLIRLFPLRFWQDAFIFVSILSLIIGVIIIIFSNKHLETGILKEN